MTHLTGHPPPGRRKDNHRLQIKSVINKHSRYRSENIYKKNRFYQNI